MTGTCRVLVGGYKKVPLVAVVGAVFLCKTCCSVALFI